MISDVLHEAIEGIDHYLNDECYDTLYAGDLRKHIVDVRDAMEKVRQELDTIPEERADKED